MTNKRTHAYLKYDFINKTIKLPEKHEEQKTERQKTGIIYARVSTDEQKIRGNGISAQIIDCETWAKRNNVKIMHDPFVDEGISGTKLNRKGFIDAIEYIEKMNKDHPTIDYFICNSTSRFSRSHNLSDTFDMVGRVNSAGAQLVAVGNGGIQDMDSDAGFLNFGLNSLMDAVESKRGQKRVRYGVTGKIMSGYRPFGHVPVGYDRITIKEGGQELKILVVDEEKAPIIKSGLELFADGVLLTKHDLFEYFHERGLKSNSKINKTGELHPSIIDRMLDVWKLFVYAGYITYPKRGINEIIPAKHTPLIDMNTVDKIMIRLKKYKGIDHEKRAYDQDIDDYPLKRLLLCPECDKAVTKWKSRSHTGAYHHYYGCNTKGCKLYKKGLPRDKVHESVIKKLQEITPSRNIEKFFDAIFKEERNTEKLDMKNANKTKEKELAKLKEERDKIEIILNNITDPKLFKKKEEHRAEINQKIEDVEYSMRDITFEKSEFQRNLNDAKTILFNPTAMWKFGDAEIKQLLIGVCFNNKIYYKKNQGCRTPEISPIYGYLASLGDKKTPNPEGQGFEPWLHRVQTRTPNVRLQPLGQPSTQVRIIITYINTIYFINIILHYPVEILIMNRILILPHNMISKNIIKESIITYSIIAINVIIFILETLAGGSTDTSVTFNFGAHFTPVTTYQPRRLFTAIFLHFGIIHLAMNMLALHNLGPAIEKIFGKRKYLIIYIFSGIAGNLTVFGVESLTGNYSLSAGASGAIFGILGAYLAITITLSKETKGQFDTNQVISTIVYALAPGFFISGISMSAHVGGLIGGFIISYILIIITRKKLKSQSYDTGK